MLPSEPLERFSVILALAVSAALFIAVFLLPQQLYDLLAHFPRLLQFLMPQA